MRACVCEIACVRVPLVTGDDESQQNDAEHNAKQQSNTDGDE